MNSATFRFYAELNDFLAPSRRQRAFEHCFNGSPGVKDAIEALGVPHTEVDLILVNGASVGFDYRLQDGDWVSVYPMFEAFDISSMTRLRPEPLRQPIFILDAHLGRLARYLRLSGFDSLYRNDYHDAEIATIAARENRIVLTRDRGLLKRGAVTHGYCVRETAPLRQWVEVARRFDLVPRFKPFTRCLECNGEIEPVEAARVEHLIPPYTRETMEEFGQCRSCGSVYWKGTHYDRLQRLIEAVQEEAG